MFSQKHNNIITNILQFLTQLYHKTYFYQKGVNYVFYSSRNANRFRGHPY